MKYLSVTALLGLLALAGAQLAAGQAVGPNALAITATASRMPVYLPIVIQPGTPRASTATALATATVGSATPPVRTATPSTATPSTATPSTATANPLATPSSTVVPNATAQAGATASPTPTPPSVVPLLNGDFEQGSAGWTASGATIGTTFPGWVTPHSGAWAVTMMDATAGQLLAQRVSVPPNQPYLGYWVWSASSELVCSRDTGGVRLTRVDAPHTQVADSFAVCAATNTNTWVKRVVNLQSLAGQLCDLELFTATSGTVSNSQLFIDDVLFQATP